MPAQNAANKQPLLAGAVFTDITPRAGTHLSGSGMGDQLTAQSVVDRLSAKRIISVIKS